MARKSARHPRGKHSPEAHHQIAALAAAVEVEARAVEAEARLLEALVREFEHHVRQFEREVEKLSHHLRRFERAFEGPEPRHAPVRRKRPARKVLRKAARKGSPT